MEAGDQFESRTGYEYLTPSPTVAKVMSPNTTVRTSVIHGAGWEQRLTPNTYNYPKRRQSESALA
jgi:hypothetical protein